MSTLPERKAIMIVEDNASIAEIIKDTLNGEPEYQAVAVHDGALALEVVRSLRASLVLLDLNIPGMDGLQIYDMMQADPMLRQIPVIFLTANANREEFRRRRFTNILEKPFDLDDLLAQVAAVLKQE